MDEYRHYASLATAKKAINTAGLGQMFVRYDTGMSGRIRPVVLCDLQEDVREIRDRGFAAERKMTAFREGATVFLRDDVAKAKPGELAVIERFVDSIGDQVAPGACRLDRPIGGTRWWNISDLELLSPEEED